MDGDTCPRHYAGGHAPLIVDPKLSADTVPLCYEAFAVLYSGVSRTPLYAAERLTRESVAAARSVDRAESFHEEERLPARSRVALGDYVRSGYDRGHMAPAGDMPTPQAQAESFTLANVVPQDRASNRGLWGGIEESVRRLAIRRGELYVVTGPIFSGNAIQSIDGRVLVPTHLYKAVYDPVRREAAAYLAPNDDSDVWRVVSLTTLSERVGLDLFPGVPDATKREAMPLPEPRLFARDQVRYPRRDNSWGSWLRDSIHRILRRLWSDLMRAIF